MWLLEEEEDEKGTDVCAMEKWNILLSFGYSSMIMELRVSCGCFLYFLESGVL